jgi:hypothetical protein
LGGLLGDAIGGGGDGAILTEIVGAVTVAIVVKDVAGRRRETKQQECVNCSPSDTTARGPCERMLHSLARMFKIWLSASVT